MNKEARVQRNRFLKKFAYGFFCAVILILLLTGLFYFLANPSIALIFAIVSSIGLVICCWGFFNVAYFAFTGCYFTGLFGAGTLIYFIRSMLNNSYAAFQQGDGLDLPRWLGITIVVISIGFFGRFFYKLYKTINFDTFFKETLAAKNYDLENKIYYTDAPNKEPEFEWSFLKKKKDNGLSNGERIAAILILFTPFLHPGYAIIMSKTHSIGMGFIGIIIALPISLALIYFTLVLYVPYHSYKRIQQELGVTLKPAISKIA